MLQRRAIAMLVVAANSLCGSISVSADDKSCARGPDDHTTALIKLLSPPPCDDCDETKAELKELTQMQEARAPAEQEHAKADITISIPRFLEGANIKFDPAALDKCNDFFEKLSKLTKEASDNAKTSFCRTRPYNLTGSALQPLQSIAEEQPVLSLRAHHLRHTDGHGSGAHAAREAR